MKPVTATVATFLAASTIVAGSAAARPPEGGYFAFGLGYAIASGDRGVPLKGTAIPVEASGAIGEEIVRTDFGSGMSFELRFGWLIGPIAPELSVFGHGTFDFENGAGYPGLNIRFHPFMLIDSMADSKIDANVFIGGGYVIGGYQPDEDKIPVTTKGKGWDGWYLAFGVGASYELSKRVHLGLDVKFALPMYSQWMFDWDEDINFEPESTPSTMVIAPSLQIQAFF